ncbi:putative AAA+ ATPase domain, ABC transporter, G1 [Helianthus annuus]|uniref:AAA+ ATPase domain, ABC transporter, G1 n=1 Tax=Helianthus annuus TaxID=4232 RepID=A0A251T8H9_HELAN|nr:ABC transporter G family member 25 [Helianthus annuus]KAF5780437.1 putative AAA+ ATPase domain, ABC transporter, G1 [Helianthus annuus]KAJ0500257.1 putative ABC transporter, AAA+ ATPase domain, ABC-2 type transporter [Helianthus annuus]KAJ0516089.1 putative ABC transporter, AAA+ ATPase domain, ABC-2 type transporter [Helianthus annuus]KAJ0684107.1 putative ABC transporter, AAA+ ATPase domain, ABC-2 type transporter [Helianthus annuus]KAJ0688065.1 putative ABC transporter, AAA+ ATPase domain
MTQQHPIDDHPPKLQSSFPIHLQFIDISYKVKTDNNKTNGLLIKHMFKGGGSNADRNTIRERVILTGITGMVNPGEVLAVLGPSGSGKSTLLNALAGRLPEQCFSGKVVANGAKMTKSVLKRTGFVTQDDVLYPHLTVRETLIFCALLRLPKSLSRREKMEVADSVIAELGLCKCADTIIGNTFIRGVSGGERKRVSIGHEMLVNPSLLILDEPTSGLDSTAAHKLMSTLGGLAHQKGKTVVTSVHQPSSRVFQTFDTVLVLSEGRCIYFGKGSKAMSYFESVDFRPSFPMNPADFLLDLANGVWQQDNVTEKERPNVKQTLISAYNDLLASKVKDACSDSASEGLTPVKSLAPKEYRTKCENGVNTWFNQFTILIQRSLKERKHETFNPLRVFQVIAASLLAGLMWWHSDFRDIQDRLGLLFFFTIFWGVFPSFNAVFAFPQDRAVFTKEQASGMYSLSSYFMARIVGDAPMELILPTMFLSITYWMCGLKPELGAFILTLLILLAYVLVSQGLGFAVGAIIMDAKQASTVVTVTMLAFVLTGGYYVHKVPIFIAWMKYISTTFYTYKLLIRVQYGQGRDIWYLLGCFQYRDRHASCKFIEDDIEGQISTASCIGVLLIMFFGYRLLAYLALRRIKA